MKLSIVQGKPVLSTKSFSIGLDCHHGDAAFISHAHSDHSSFGRKAKKVLASAETISLMRARGAYTAFETISATEIPGARVELLSSGHVLGGKQLFAQEGSKSFLYTGDFKCSPSLTAGSAEVVHADELLMECTYGKKTYSFPPRQKVYGELSSWAKEIVECGEIAVIGAYSLGKAQEVVRALNNAGLCPVVNGETHRVCSVYCNHGVALDYRLVENGFSEKLRTPFAAVVPMGTVNAELSAALSAYYGVGVKTAVATGWSAGGAYAGVDAAFPLSDHEDYGGLVSFVKKVSPQKVFCTHGFSKEFAESLKKEGFDAIALEEVGKPTQKLLSAES